MNLRKRVKEKEMSNKGITLIALVITIIVLLILAGISIAMLTGENGILTKASKAKEETQRTDIIERARIEVLGIQSENEGAITKSQFKNVLDIYFQNVPNEDEFPDNLSTLKLTTKEAYGNYEIKASEIYNENFQGEGEDLDKVKYTVTYDFNGGTGNVKSQIKVEGKDLILTNETPTRQDYTFLGWVTDKTKKDVEYNLGAIYSQDSDITLYAVWKYAGPDLLLFDYNNGGIQFDYTLYKPFSDCVPPSLTNDYIGGVCTYKDEHWARYQSVDTFDITKFGYLYFEGIFSRTYASFSEVFVGLDGAFSSNRASWGNLPKSTEYTSYYLDIHGNSYNSMQLYLGVKMQGDFLRYAKFTNDKPEGTYLGSISDT